jgi:uncharacterized repeat protein (TIGR03806 family)
MRAPRIETALLLLTLSLFSACGEDSAEPETDAVDDVSVDTDGGSADVLDDSDSAEADTADVADTLEDTDPDTLADAADTLGDVDADDVAIDATDAHGSDAADAATDTTIPDRPRLDTTSAWPTLSEWAFFTDMNAQTPNNGVIPYTVVSPLWADHAGKGRYFVLPEGTQITFGAEETWEFPEGSVVIKTFFHDLDRRDPGGAFRIVETRLLVRRDGDWKSYTYVWNDEQNDATLAIAGGRVFIDVIDEAGEAVTQEYIVPNLNQCGNCHERSDQTQILGLVTQQLNFETELDGETQNHLEWLAAQGVFDAELPPAASLPALADPHGDGELDDRARAWLHANCGHCHRPGGGGGRSGLTLLAWEEDPARYGVCKSPIAAGAGTGGRSYDIVPGFPDQSIMLFRILSSDPEVKMPELPNRLPDPDGVALLEEWISAMTPTGCE